MPLPNQHKRLVLRDMKSSFPIDAPLSALPGTPLPKRLRLRLSRSGWLDLALTVALFLVALVPRWLLLHQLDIVTDESVYVPVGRMDISLLARGQLLSPSWLINYEAPTLPKLFIGVATVLAGYSQPSYAMVQAARVPGALLSALALALLYPLGRPIFGRWPALLGALCLALSPWFSYFSSIAYLDIYAASFVNLAFLTLWYARQRPRLYLLAGSLLGLGFASKYTAALALPGIAVFLFYRYRLVERSRLPWRMLGLGALAGLGALYLADPAIWVNPVVRLAESIGFQFGHAETGHQTFFAGSYGGHVPPGAVFLILLVKMSLFVVIPALLFLPWALWHLARRGRCPRPEDLPVAFGLCWLGGLLLPFSFLSIVVGTHYMLPLAAPICLLGAYTLLRVLGWRLKPRLEAAPPSLPAQAGTSGRLSNPALAQVLVIAVAAVALVLPHALGLVNSPDAEGYTSEAFSSENRVLQVAYPGYADAVVWLHAHAHTPGNVGLVALPHALDYWMLARQDLQTNALPLTPATPDAIAGYTYLVWPMHLIQRGYLPPAAWQGKTVHAIMGGATVYCYILASNPASIGP